jgi:hypothetical protein
MKKNHFIILAVIVIGIASAIFVVGCTTARPDPEISVTAWVTAVNNHDYDRIYDLAPQVLRQQISRPAFIAAQKENPLLAQGNFIKGYTVTNKTISGTDAEITAKLVLHQRAIGNESAGDILLYIKFVEIFENGKWDIWTTAP